MDKQIIIDGVDVSGSRQYMPRHMEDYDIDTLDYCRYHFKPCKDVDIKYCYFKQLKRKEQALNEIEKYLDAQQKYFDGEDYHNLLDIISKARGQINDR